MSLSWLLGCHFGHFLVVYSSRFLQYHPYVKDLVICLVLKYQWSKWCFPLSMIALIHASQERLVARRFFLFELIYIWVSGWSLPIFLFLPFSCWEELLHLIILLCHCHYSVNYYWAFGLCTHGLYPKVVLIPLSLYVGPMNPTGFNLHCLWSSQDTVKLRVTIILIVLRLKEVTWLSRNQNSVF